MEEFGWRKKGWDAAVSGVGGRDRAPGVAALLPTSRCQLLGRGRGSGVEGMVPRRLGGGPWTKKGTETISIKMLTTKTSQIKDNI